METPQLGSAPTTHLGVRIEREKNEFFHVAWPRDALCSSQSCQDGAGGTGSAATAAPGGMSRSGTAPGLQIPP